MTEQISALVTFIEDYNKNKIVDDIIKYKIDLKASELTTFKIGGKIDAVIYPSSKKSMCDVLSYLEENKIKHLMLGRGSNVLFEDNGYSGVVVSAYGLSEIKTEGEYLIAECGVPITLCAAAAQKASLEGMEFAYGIPGSCGGAVVMNAGAYGGSMSDVIESTLCYDCESGKLIEISADEHKFGYRESIYHSNPKLVMLEAKMKLKFGDSDAIYAKMNEYMQRRTQKQPLEYPSAGSVFKRYPGYYTAELIDNAGLKGMRIGGAEVSEKHAGFIINKGGATAEDVKQLIKLIQDRIKRMYDIEIEREVIYIE